MLKYTEFINEASRGKKGSQKFSVTFTFDGKEVILSSTTLRDIFCKVVDWLYDKGFSFDDIIISKSEMYDILNKTSYSKNHFHDINNTGKIIQIHNNADLPIYLKSRINDFLGSFGIKDTNFQGFDSYKKTTNIEEVITEKNITFVKAAQMVLRDNKNIPMTSKEIWDDIVEFELPIKTLGKTPISTLNAQLLMYCGGDSTKISKSYKTKLFEIVGENPMKFKLLNPDEIQDVPDIEDVDYKSSDKSEKVIYSINPFRQAICVIGESGAGKSYTIEDILEKENHDFQFIIPTAATTGLCPARPLAMRKTMATSRPSKTRRSPNRMSATIKRLRTRSAFRRWIS